jgi:hypothetical protein
MPSIHPGGSREGEDALEEVGFDHGFGIGRERGSLVASAAGMLSGEKRWRSLHRAVAGRRG